MAQGVRADPHPEPLERFGRLLGPRSSRRDGVQDADHRGVAGERQQLGFGWKRWSRQKLYDRLGLFSEYRSA